jgi:hypothetical protein
VVVFPIYGSLDVLSYIIKDHGDANLARKKWPQIEAVERNNSDINIFKLIEA